MAIPSLRVAGTRADTNQASLSPSYPSGIVSGDIILLHAFFHEGTTTTTGVFSDPTGFTLVRRQNVTVSGAKKGELVLWWRRADGSESGTVSVTRSGGTGNGTVTTANMTVWQGCVTTGDPWEGLTGASDESPPHTLSVTTTSTDREAIVWVFANDNLAASGTDANWTNVIAPYTDATGVDYAGHVARRDAATANTYSGSWSQSAGIEGALIGLALIGQTNQQFNSSPSGSLSFSGAVAKLLNRVLSASLGFSGAAVKSINRSLTASLSLSSAMARSTARSLVATLGFTGATTKRTDRSVGGSVTFSGTVAKQPARAHGGTVSFSTSFTPELLAPGTPALVIVHFHTE
jgi:hypothetical protein